MRLTRLLALAVLVAGPLCGSAFAQSSRFYLSASAGFTSFSFDSEHLQLANNATVNSTDKSSMYYGFRVGYKFGEKSGWAIVGEAGANNLGNMNVRGVNAAGTANYTASIKTTNYTVGAIVSRPLNDRLSFSLRGGLVHSEHNYTITPGLPTNFKVDPDRGGSWYAGAGLGLKINDHWAVEGEVDHYDASQKANTFGGNVRFTF